MFEKIGRYAETMATSAVQSRRGFLGRLGKAALGVAGVVGALLLLPGKAQASIGYCEYICPNGKIVLLDCSCGDPSIKHAGQICPLNYRACPYR